MKPNLFTERTRSSRLCLPPHAAHADQRDEDLFIASLAVAEIQQGILEKPAGKKRNTIEAWFSGPGG